MNIYHAIHTHPRLADAAYSAWRAIYNAKETLSYNPFKRRPPMRGLNVAITSACNLTCQECGAYKQI